MEAVMTDNEDLVSILLRVGADKNRSVTGGTTALSLAKEINNPAIIKLLEG